MNNSGLSYLDQIDEPFWQQVVRTLLDCDRAEIRSRSAEEIFVGAGAGTRVFRVAGTADTPGRRVVDWTMVVKILTLDNLGFQSTSTVASKSDYWKREWHAYRSAWQQQLPGPLVAAHCFGTGEITLDRTGEQLAWIAMEDLGPMQHRPWSDSDFRTVGRHLGIFNGRYLYGMDEPTDPWLADNWLRGWTEQAGQVTPRLPDATAHPVAGRIFTTDLVDDLCQVWEQRENFYNALEQLPRTLCHNDVFARNVFLRGDGKAQSVAIDWAFCGPAPVGSELSALVGTSQAFMESRPERWDDLERICLDGYTNGLRETGRVGADEVFAGYVLSSALRGGIGSLPPVLGLTLTTEHMDLVGRLFGCSYDEFVAHAAAFMRFQQRCIHRARALLGL